MSSHVLWCEFGYDRYSILVLFAHITYQPCHAVLILYSLTMISVPFCSWEMWLLFHTRGLVSSGLRLHSPPTAITATHSKPFLLLLLFIWDKEEADIDDSGLVTLG